MKYGEVMPGAQSVVNVPLKTSGGGATLVRWLGTALVVVGLGLLAWAFVTWRWEDPFTSVYTAWEQRQLESELAALTHKRPPIRPIVPGEPRTEAVASIRRSAAGFRHDAQQSAAIGRLRVPAWASTWSSSKALTRRH